jgi:hypothetical protein
MRWLPFAAWILSFVGLILSLVTLLAGVTGDSLESAAILTVRLTCSLKIYRCNVEGELGVN